MNINNNVELEFKRIGLLSAYGKCTTRVWERNSKKNEGETGQ